VRRADLSSPSRRAVPPEAGPDPSGGSFAVFGERAVVTLAPERFALCIAAFIACVACAGTGTSELPPEGPGSARTPTGQPLAPQAAIDMVAVGKSSKADVASALGPAIAIRFDSGYEVWVYRWAGPDKTRRGATELVVLFEPSGLAAKVRLRPGYATRD
jgi:hypothetical protein